MKFWEPSALVALCIEESESPIVKGLLDADPGMAVWWSSCVECWSAFARRRCEGLYGLDGEDEARKVLSALREGWFEVLPSEEIRLQAGRLLRVHALRAADALQLAAALAWRGGSPATAELVTYDHRLREAARFEGLIVCP